MNTGEAGKRAASDAVSFPHIQRVWVAGTSPAMTMSG
jgi:hypothetical protein